MTPQRISTALDWVVLEVLSPRYWRVIDEGEEQLLGDGTIGHIRLFLGVFETLRTSGPRERTYFDSLRDAVESFSPWPLSTERGDEGSLESA